MRPMKDAIADGDMNNGTVENSNSLRNGTIVSAVVLVLEQPLNISIEEIIE